MSDKQMNMIEKVARAIAPQAWSVAGIINQDNLAQSSRRKASLKHAKAAILAMREPTEEMLRSSFNYEEIPGQYSNINARYTAMIDAALKE